MQTYAFTYDTVPANAIASTEKQRGFICKLSQERRLPVPLGFMTRADASKIIDQLLKTPVPAGVTPSGATSGARASATATITDTGMYRTADGRIYKVQASKETGNLYAKELVPIGGQRLTDVDTVVSFEFVYAKGAVYTLTDADRLTIADAKAFGIRYGVCCVCGKTLSDAKSVAAGIGPVCAKRV